MDVLETDVHPDWKQHELSTTMTKVNWKHAFLAMIAAPSMVFASGGGGGGGGGSYVKMAPMVVNLETGHYIQFLTQIKPKVQNEKDGGAARIPLYMPVIRHELMKSLLGQRVGTVQTPEFMESFSHSTAELINKILDDNVVEAVFFENWIIQ